MPRQEFTGYQIKDGTIYREDLNTTITGKAIVRRILPGSGVSLISTGADSGTGDVTINATIDPFIIIDDTSDSTALVWSSHKTKTSIQELIDDGIISTDFTWSSQEIIAQIDGLIDDSSDSTALVWSSHKVKAEVLDLSNTFTSHTSNLTIHRELNDTIRTSTNLWSAEKIKQVIDAGGGGGGTGDASVAWDTYSDLLNSTAFLNATFDSFDSTAYIDIVTSDMIYDEVLKQYDFSAGEILQSINLFDSVSGITSVDKCLISIDYEDTGTPTIQASANGGVNWDSVTLNTIHEFSFPGNDLRLKFTGGGTGSVLSWAILYNYDEEAVTTIPSPISFEYTTNLNDLQFTGDYIYLNVIENSVGIGATLSMDSSGNLIESVADSTSFILCQYLACEIGTGNNIVLMKGLLRNSSWSFIPGQPIFLSTSSGQLTQSRPTNPGEIIQVIGVALTSDIIRFEPDMTWLELG